MSERTVQLIKPHKNQLTVINSCLQDDCKWVVAAISRQFGKSLMAQNLAVYWAINEPNSIIMWISPSDAQAQKVYKEIARALLNCGVIRSQKGSSGDTEIIFNNDSKILFRSSKSENSLRGYAVDYMILDECAFMKRETIEEIIIPMLTVRGKKCLFLSTPKGKNWFYEYFQKGKDNSDPSWKSFRFTVYDTPLVSQDFIENQKSLLIDVAFRQEYLAEFVDSASIFDNVNDILIIDYLEKPTPNKHWGGIDVGLINDATVFSIFDEDGNCQYYYKWENIDTERLLTEIERVYKAWNIVRCHIETNGMGEPIYQLLKTRVKGLIPWTTNNKNKGDIINNLVKLFRLKEIKLPNTEDLRDELESFQYKQNDVGVVRYSAASGSHDDIIMSISIGRECWAKYNQVSDYKKHYKLWN